jgi:DNA-3-methyladenine glycosylase
MAARIAVAVPRPLPGAFYRRETAEVARALLGCRLARRFPDGTERAVIVVETEAYLGIADRAAHTWNGRRTARVAPMWGPGGHAYVYLVYGMHFCLNVVTREAGVPEAVLLRAGTPEDLWLKLMGPKSTVALKVNRASSLSKQTPVGLLVASGPALLCRYLRVDTRLSGASLSGPELLLSRGPEISFDVVTGPRVGVDYAGEAARWPLRFAVAGCRAVTRPRGLSPEPSRKLD